MCETTTKPTVDTLSTEMFREEVTGLQQLRWKFFGQLLSFKTLKTYWPSFSFESCEDGRHSALVSKVLVTDFLSQSSIRL